MKLRNKETGEIAEFIVHKRIEDSKDGNQVYAPFAINPEEWEYYEEPKEYWTIDWTCIGVTTNKYSGDDVDDFNKSIGNYFETKEEAEEAVEKLKAWKRLKDDNFKFEGWYYDVEPISNGRVNIQIRATFDESDYASLSDLELLFGGEE